MRILPSILALILITSTVLVSGCNYDDPKDRLDVTRPSKGKLKLAENKISNGEGMKKIDAKNLRNISKAQGSILRIKGIKHSNISFTVRFYLNVETSNQSKPDDKHYAASFYMYGHGDAIADKSTINELEPFDNDVDFSFGEKLIKLGEDNTLHIVVIDQQGNILPASEFKYEKIELVSE